MITDFHTHDTQAQNALICVEPDKFAPMPGMTYAVGVHPWHTACCTHAMLSALEAAATHPQVAAIGETGLDSLQGAPIGTQIEIFRLHIELAERLGKPLIVHMVRTSQDVLKLWKESQRLIPWAIHGMRGNLNVAYKLMEAGFYFSFGARFNADTLKAMPHDRILAETDDDSSHSIDDVIALIADTIGMSHTETKLLVSRNAATFLSL